jgi:hypothetical protein
MLLAALVAAPVRGQIGRPPADFQASWGAPHSELVNSNGYGTLRFGAGNLEIEAEFVAGVAQRAVYRAPALGASAIQRILDANRDGADWQIYQRPGSGSEDDGRRTWSRGEDSAMAELAEGVLTIVGSGWYRHLAEPPPAAVTNGIEPNRAAAPAAEVPAPPPPDGILGFWQTTDSEQPTVALHARENGALSWVALGQTGRRVLNARWERQSTGDKPTYALTQAREHTGTKPQVRTIGCLEWASPTQLIWRAGGTATEGDAPGTRGDTKAARLFKRVARMPQWKPQAPAVLPATGDSTEAALRLLGNPTGTVSTGGREILLYPWGAVWTSNGVVVATE